jgi:cold shock CspA family protein
MRQSGRILSVSCEFGFGFIQPNRGLPIHFDKRNLVNLDFDPGIAGREVSFRAVTQPGCKSLTARDIRNLTPRTPSRGNAFGFKLRHL